MKTILNMIVISTVVGLSACSTKYTVRVINQQANEVFLVHDKDSDVKAGDVFGVYRITVHNGSGGGHDHGGSSQHLEKQLVGSVKVTQIVDDRTAAVSIVFGTVEDGFIAEKTK